MRVKRGWRHPKPGSTLMDARVRSHAGMNTVRSAQLGGVPDTEYPVLQGSSYWPAATRNVLHQKENTWNIKSPGLLFGLLEWDSVSLAHTCALFDNRTLTAAALFALACLLLYSHQTRNKTWRGLFLHLLLLHRAVQPSRKWSSFTVVHDPHSWWAPASGPRPSLHHISYEDVGLGFEEEPVASRGWRES